MPITCWARGRDLGLDVVVANCSTGTRVADTTKSTGIGRHRRLIAGKWFRVPHAFYAEGASTRAVYWRRRIGASPTSAERTASTPTSVLSSFRMISFPARESGQRARRAVR